MPNLAPCPDCRNMCSLTAVSCPKCGRVFQPGDLQPQAGGEADKHPFLLLIFVFVIFLMIVFGVKMSQEMREDQKLRQRILEGERIRGGG